MSNQEPVAYALDPEKFKILKEIEQRLYNDRILTPDERRDLANRMNAVLGSATRIEE